jgi:hypothetical protein
LDAASSVAALAEGFKENDCSGGGDVEGADAAGHGNAQEVVAGAADEIVEARALAAEDEDAVSGEVELVVIGLAALVETDDPDVLTLEFFKGADEVDYAGDAQVLGCAGAGLDGNRTQGSGTALGEHDAVNSGTVGHAQQGAEVLRVFNAVESEEQAGGTRNARREEVFDGEKFLRVDQGHDALVSGGLGELGQLLAGFLADANAGLAAEGDEAGDAGIFTLAGHENVVKAAMASLEGFFDWMQPVENFHSFSVEDGRSGVECLVSHPFRKIARSRFFDFAMLRSEG